MKLFSEKHEGSPRSSMNDTQKASKWLRNSILGLLDAAKDNTDLTENQIIHSVEQIYLEFCKKSGIRPNRNIEHHGVGDNE